MFTLIEVVPLVTAIVASWATGQTGVAAPWRVAVCGLGIVVASYLHLFAVLFVAGWVRSVRSQSRGEKR